VVSKGGKDFAGRLTMRMSSVLILPDGSASSGSKSEVRLRASAPLRSPGWPVSDWLTSAGGAVIPTRPTRAYPPLPLIALKTARVPPSFSTDLAASPQAEVVGFGLPMLCMRTSGRSGRAARASTAPASAFWAERSVAALPVFVGKA